MYCKNCGNQMDPNAAVCVKCGCAKGVGTTFCPNCGQTTMAGAAVCDGQSGIVHSDDAIITAVLTVLDHAAGQHRAIDQSQIAAEQGA